LAILEKTANASVADRWLKKRREALVKAEASLSDPVVLDWQQEIAVRNGVPPDLSSGFLKHYNYLL
jgi:hypothetical protein